MKKQKTVPIELTKKGQEITKNPWNSIADPYLATATMVKLKLFAMSPEEIKEMVHEDYPEFKGIYKFSDREEKLKI